MYEGRECDGGVTQLGDYIKKIKNMKKIYIFFFKLVSWSYASLIYKLKTLMFLSKVSKDILKL